MVTSEGTKGGAFTVANPDSLPAGNQRPGEMEANRKLLAQYTVDRETLRHVKEIGKGQFGLVFLSVQSQSSTKGYTGSSGAYRHCRRAVKVLTSTEGSSNYSNDSAFLAEAALQAPLDHPNVLRLIGVSMEKRPWMAVLELAEYGDVRTFLKMLKTHNFELRTAEQVHLAAQVAYGLEYLHGERIVHRDIAARNVMLAAYSTAKIGDFGLARSYDDLEDSWLLTTRECVSVQWAPLEIFAAGKKYFSQKTDVWSFGVFMWEIFTYCRTPFADIATTRVPHALRAGVRLNKPEGCSQAMHKIITSCWKVDPASRATFLELKEALLKQRATITQADGYNTVRDFAGIFKQQIATALQDKLAAQTNKGEADREDCQGHTSTTTVNNKVDDEQRAVSTQQQRGRRSRISSNSSILSGGDCESIVFGFHNEIDNQHDSSLKSLESSIEEPIEFGFGEQRRRRSSGDGHAAVPQEVVSSTELDICVDYRLHKDGTTKMTSTVHTPLADDSFAYERYSSTDKAHPKQPHVIDFADNQHVDDDCDKNGDDFEEFTGFSRVRRYSERDSPSSTPTRNMSSPNTGEKLTARSQHAVTWEAPDHYSLPRSSDGGDDSSTELEHVPRRAVQRSSSSTSIGSGTSSQSTPDGALRLGTCASCGNGLAPGDWYHHRTRNTGVCHRCFHLGYRDQSEHFFWVTTTDDIVRALSPSHSSQPRNESVSEKKKVAAPAQRRSPSLKFRNPATPASLSFGTPAKLSTTKRTKIALSFGTPPQERKRTSNMLPATLVLSQPGQFGGLRMVNNPYISTASDVASPSSPLSFNTALNRG